MLKTALSIVQDDLYNTVQMVDKLIPHCTYCCSADRILSHYDALNTGLARLMTTAAFHHCLALPEAIVICKG